MRNFLIISLIFLPLASLADSLIAVKTLRSNTVLQAQDLEYGPDEIGAVQRPEDAIGRETLVHIFAGQPIRAADLGPPAVIERNQVVPLKYSFAGLNIATEGRALERGAVGARIRVMNLASRSTVMGVVLVDGTISVPPRRP